MIRIGFHTVPVMNPDEKSVLNVNYGGKLIFNGDAHIGKGTKIVVHKGAIIELGDNFAVSASSQFNCYKYIKIGKEVQFSWDCLVMDNDTHEIISEDGYVYNAPSDIIIDDKVLVFCRTIILKGTHIPHNTVIGAQSLVSGKNFEQNSLIAGNPAKIIKKIQGWNI